MNRPNETVNGEFYLSLIVDDNDEGLTVDDIELILKGILSADKTFTLSDIACATEDNELDNTYEVTVTYKGEAEWCGEYCRATLESPAEYPWLEYDDEATVSKTLKELIVTGFEERGINIFYDELDSWFDSEEDIYERAADDAYDDGPDPDEAYDRWKDDRDLYNDYYD